MEQTCEDGASFAKATHEGEVKSTTTARKRLTLVKDSVTTNYSYDAADDMTAAGSDSYTWNANGALTSKVSGGVTTTFDWDFDDYMTKITQGATVVEFKYDGLKRRAQRSAGGATRDFKYANDQIMVEKEGATIVAEYMLARSMIFREASGTKETYHYDWIGTARALTDATQTVLATYNYEAFGSVVGATGSSGNSYKFDGAWRYRDDGDFGLLHVGARYYEPAVGRWLSEDPVIGNPQWAQTLNRFVYVANNPSNDVDPNGEFPWLLFVVVVLVLAVQEGEQGTRVDKEIVGAAAVVAVGEVAVAAAAVEVTVGGSNILLVISRPLKCGFRIDRAHHRKPSGHCQIWQWWKKKKK